jgi:hypothetical protein
MDGREKHSTLLGLLISYEENEVLRIRTMAGKASQGQTL